MKIVKARGDRGTSKSVEFSFISHVNQENGAQTSEDFPKIRENRGFCGGQNTKICQNTPLRRFDRYVPVWVLQCPHESIKATSERFGALMPLNEPPKGGILTAVGPVADNRHLEQKKCSILAFPQISRLFASWHPPTAHSMTPLALSTYISNTYGPFCLSLVIPFPQ